MTDSKKLNLLMQLIKPDSLDIDAFITWWETQGIIWRYNYREHLRNTLELCASHEYETCELSEIYDKVRMDDKAILILKELGGFSVEEWQNSDEIEDSEYVRKMEYFGGMDVEQMLSSLAWELVDWFDYLTANISDITNEEDSTVIDNEFFEIFKKI